MSDQPDTAGVAAFTMPLHRRMLAWIVTDRVGQGLALTVMFAWAVVLYTRARLSGKRPGAAAGDADAQAATA